MLSHDTNESTGTTAGEGGHTRRVARSRWALGALGGLALGGLLLLLLLAGRGEEPAPPPARVEVPAETTSAAEPAPGVPVRLKIPRLGIDASVVPVGITSDGVMESPEGPDDTGWYEPGVRPGEQGSAVIAGHSGYRTGPAVFDDLGEVREGDEILIVGEDGSVLIFRVRETRTYEPYARVPEVFTRDDGRHLNLVTCTGQFDAAAGTHSERLVVFADLDVASSDRPPPDEPSP